MIVSRLYYVQLGKSSSFDFYFQFNSRKCSSGVLAAFDLEPIFWYPTSRTLSIDHVSCSSYHYDRCPISPSSTFDELTVFSLSGSLGRLGMLVFIRAFLYFTIVTFRPSFAFAHLQIYIEVTTDYTDR